MKGLELFALGGFQRQLLAFLRARARGLHLRNQRVQAHQQSRWRKKHVATDCTAVCLRIYSLTYRPVGLARLIV